MTSMDVDSPTTGSMAITPVFPNDNNELAVSEEQPNKRRRKKSIVWEHFTIETVGAGCMRACCKQCKKSFAYITGSKLAGTSHLKRHIALGICPVSRQKNEALQSTPGAKTDPPKRRYRASPVFGGIPFDQYRCNQDVARMVIQHEYPLHMVEHPSFVEFVRTLQPQYNMVSFDTIQGECVALYLREKQSLLNVISGIPGRMSLTLDLGTSNFNIGYAFLTGHFIDEDWNLHRRLLNVVMLPFPDSDYAFNQAVVSCLSDWHLENRLFTLTLDESFSNETIIGNLRSLLSSRNPHVFNGQLLRGNCYARVLSRLAQDAIGAMGDVIRRIRESVKYVKTSETHDEKFAELRQRLQVPSTKELIIDDQTKWNTTYEMLVAACELKEVFACLDTTDPVYKINPSINDWKQVEILCTYLKLLYDAASILVSPTYPPANAFYHEVSKVQLELTHASMSQDPFVSNLTRPLKEKFDQYWKECFLVLAIAVVMDPRFKMKLVEFSFSRIFGEEAGMWIKMVDDGIHELFLEYLAPNLSVPTSYMEAGDANISRSEIFQEMPAQEVSFEEVPIQGVHSAHAGPQEANLQGATLEQVQPEVIPQVLPKEEHPQVMPAGQQGMQTEETHEAPLQEMWAEEAPLQEMRAEGAPPQEMHTEGAPLQEMQTEGAPLQGMQTEEAPMQEMQTEEAPVQEIQTEEAPVQEIQTEEAPVQEIQTEEAPVQEIPTEEAPVQEIPTEEAPVQEMHTEEAPVQEMHTEEVQQQVMNNQEASSVETDIQQVSLQENQSQKVSTQEMHTQEASTQEMHTQEASTQEMQTQEVSTQEMQTQEGQTQEIRAKDEAPQELHAKEPTQEIHAKEPTEEMHPQEVPAEEMHNQEVPTEEIHPQEGQNEEPHPQGQNEEIHPLAETEEVHPQGQTEEMHPQGQTEEMHSQGQTGTEEMQSQETHSPEANPQDMHPAEAQAEEVHPPEAQNLVLHPPEAENQKIENQEMRPIKAETPEVHFPEVETQEIDIRQTLEIQPEDTHSQGLHLQEVHIHQTNHPEVPSQEFHSQEIQFDQSHHQEISNQEMHTQELQTHEMHYQSFSEEMQSHEVHTQDLPLLTIGDGLSDFEVYISEITNSQHLKSELDQYLEESLLPRVQEFDVLGWWKLNKLKYPTLSKMAADILSIPVSTVAPESVFDTGNKKIDSYRSSLRPVTLEALVCAKDWLQYGSSESSLDTSNALVKMEF